MRKTVAVLVFLTMVSALAISAQAQMEMPKPGPELKKLDYFLGDWTVEADAKPSPMGPGGKMTGKSSSEWMDGGFFVVIKSSMGGAMGDATSTAYMGYDADQKMYTYNEFNSMGQAEHATGNMNGDTWSWTDQNKVNGQMIQGRYSMKILSPAAYAFKYEISTGGDNWATVMEGKATKK